MHIFASVYTGRINLAIVHPSNATVTTPEDIYTTNLIVFGHGVYCRHSSPKYKNVQIYSNTLKNYHKPNDIL